MSPRSAVRTALAVACPLAVGFAGGTARATVLVTRPVNLQAVTPDSVTLVWSTAVPTNAVVEYGATLGYGSSEESKGQSLEHAVTLHKLQPGHLYYYRGQSAGEILYAGPDYLFRTLPAKNATR